MTTLGKASSQWCKNRRSSLGSNSCLWKHCTDPQLMMWNLVPCKLVKVSESGQPKRQTTGILLKCQNCHFFDQTTLPEKRRSHIFLQRCWVCWWCFFMMVCTQIRDVPLRSPCLMGVPCSFFVGAYWCVSLWHHRNWISGYIYITNGYNQLFNQIIKSSFTELGSTNYITNSLIMSNIHGKRCT